MKRVESGSAAGLGGVVRRFAAAPVRAQTYRNLAYLSLAFPLGLGYFVGAVTGISLGVGLLITLVGLPILGLTVVGTTLAAGLEATLASRLVGVEASLPSVLREFETSDGLVLPGDGFLDAVRRLFTAPSTWTGFVLVLSKFALGIASFVALVTTGALAWAALAAPFVYDDPSVTINLLGQATTGTYTVGPWVVDTLPAAIAVAGGGLVFLVVALNALNLFARLQATFTARLLRLGE